MRTLPGINQLRNRQLLPVLLMATAFSFGLLYLSSSSWISSGAQSVTPTRTGFTLRVHPSNRRYFTDGTGKAIYVTGSHFWTTIQDWNAARVLSITPYSGGPAFATFAEYLHFMKSRGHNFTRLWVFEHGHYESTPSVWVRTGPGTANDGQPKWNVSIVNHNYLTRLRDRVTQFRDNGLYVSVMFFRANSCKGDSCPAWANHPFNPVNNINSSLTGLTYDKYNSSDHAGSLALQKHYMKAVIDSLNDLDNVVWEIANEGRPESYPWQQELADYIRSYESGKPKQHLVGITSTYPNNNRALYRTTADWISPGGAPNSGYDPLNPPATNGSKIVISDSDHHLLQNATVAWVWKSFLRGEHPILMENELAWNLEAVRLAMGHTRVQADRMNLVAMTPQNSLSQTSYVLANRGNEYLVYAPNGGTFWVNLSAGSANTFSVEWINPATGVRTVAPRVRGGNSTQYFGSPFNDSGAVLYLKAVSAEPFHQLVHWEPPGPDNMFRRRTEFPQQGARR